MNEKDGKEENPDEDTKIAIRCSGFLRSKCGRSSLLFPALLVYGKEEHGVRKAVGTANEFLSAG